MTALLGPSGSGKTTFLNAIAGRMQSRNLHISLSLNGSVLDPVANRVNIGFVHAHEALYPTDTPVESFEFVARLKQPSLSVDERAGKVQSTIDSLRLRKCADTFMGSATVKGVSSGEKKRSSVGIELIPERDILFLDEPTTGLDSVAALELVSLLKLIALRGVCIVAVVHQPSNEIMDLFDNVMYMARGELVYYGPTRAVVPYFASSGYSCPQEYNPADYVMFILQTIGDGALLDLINGFRPRILEFKEQIESNCRRVVQDPSLIRRLKPSERANAYIQFIWLVRREFRSTVRDMTVVVLRLFISLLFATVMGFLFFQVGQNPGGALDPSHIGLVASLAIFAMFSSGQNLLIAFAAERPIAIREYGSGFYSILAYSLSKDVLELPIAFLSVLIYLTLGYLIGGLVGSFLLLVCRLV